MIVFKSKIGEIKVPTSLTEITIQQYLEVTKEGVTDFEVLECLTGVTLEQAVLIDLEPIIKTLSFIKSEELYSEIEPSNIINIKDRSILFKDDAIMRGTWGQKIYGSRLLNESKPLEFLCLYLYPKFYKINLVFGRKKFREISDKKIEKMKSELLDMSIWDVFSCVNFLRNQLGEVEKNDYEQLNSKPTAEQIEAGIDKFNVLGDFNSIDMLANGNALIYGDVEALRYEIVFPKLLKNVISTKFEKNLRNVMNKK